MSRLTLAWLVQPSLTADLLGSRERCLIEAMAEVKWWQGDKPPTAAEARQALENAQSAVVSWGAPKMTAEVLAEAHNLRRIHYAAGSVKPLVDDALWERGIRLTSSAAAIAENVAEFTIGLIILGLSNYWALTEETRQGNWLRSAGNLGMPRPLIGKTVGIVGAGQVGRRVLQLLQHFPCRVLVHDPFLDARAAETLGAEKVSFEELLRRSDVVSNHTPKLPETYHLFNAAAFAQMQDDAVLVNTARGSAIDEDALVAELRKGRFLALLDVTDPEPPAPDHPLRTLPNVRLTPHISGGINNGRLHIGRLILEQIQRDVAGEEPLYEVKQEMLPYIA